MPTSIPAYQRQDAHWMRQALLEAKKAAQLGEIPVGAVIVRDNQVIARAHNRRELDQDALAHAEVLCIRQACQTLHRWRLSGCQLYVLRGRHLRADGPGGLRRQGPQGRLCRVGGRPVCDAL